MTYKLKHCIPILRIFDEDKAKGFYIDFLGFNVDWSHRYEENFPIYLQLSKNDYSWKLGLTGSMMLLTLG